MNRLWTDTELATLRRMRNDGAQVPAIARVLDRPVPATYARLALLGIVSQPHHVVTDTDRSIVTAMLARDHSASDTELAKALGRTPGSIRHVLQSMGLINARPVIRRPGARGIPSPVTLAARAQRHASKIVQRQAIDNRRTARELRRAAEAARRLLKVARAAEVQAQVASAKTLAAAAQTAALTAGAARLAADKANGGAVPRPSKAIRPPRLPAAARVTGRPKAVRLVTPTRAAAAPAAIAAASAARAGMTAVSVGRALPEKPTDPRPAGGVPRVSGRGGWQIIRSRRRRAAALAPMGAAERSDLVARFLAEHGVTRIEVSPAATAVARLRSRGRTVVSDGPGYLVDNRVKLANDNELIAYTAARLTAR